MQIDEENILSRAISAWCKHGDSPTQPSGCESTIEEVKGKFYAVLRNCNGVLGVYAVSNKGSLRFMTDPPNALMG